MHEYTRMVYDYVERRVNNGTLIWPHTTEDAVLFAQTEISEAVEVLFARKNYLRNHPENKPTFSQSALGEELGDAIFMLIIAGIMMNCDPLASLESKVRNDARANKE